MARDLGAVLKSARPRALAALRRYCGDLEIAEDCFQDAAERALRHWPGDGLPDDPTAWLIRAGRNRYLDMLRHEKHVVQHERSKIPQQARAEFEPPDPSSLDDDLLRLIFTCCHPAIAEEAQVALTLKVIAGLSTEDVALAFLVPTRTMEQRLARARKRLKTAGIPYAVPAEAELPARLNSVMAVVYLVFNQGYSARRRDALVHVRLCDEAIWLARLLLRLFPNHAELSGLLALMLFHHSRHRARVDDAGEPVLLAQQNRSTWDRGMIGEAKALLELALHRGQPGPYQTQAAIAALHCQAAGPAETDWLQIAALYEVLARQLPNPVVTINRAVALAEVEGVEAALELLETIRDRNGMQDYVPFHVTRSELLRRAGRDDEANRSLQRAIDVSDSDRERRFLTSRLRAGASGSAEGGHV